VAYYDTSATHFEHQDWLGSERMRTSYNGAVEGSYTNLPFGDGQTTSGADGDAYHFALLDHDTESDTDHAQFRQYSNIQGRFMSPDPYEGSYNMSNPQSMNRYAYAANSPLSFIDPTGLVQVCIVIETTSVKDPYGEPSLPNPTKTVRTMTCYDDGRVIMSVPMPVSHQGSTGSGTVAPSSLPPQPNPCLVAGNAPDTSYYAQRGKAAASNSILDIYNLYHFRRGRFLDAQVGQGADGKPYGGSPSYSNYAYGVYMAAAGYTLPQALAGADMAAQLFSRYPVGTPMAGPLYPFNQQANVPNTTKGFNDQTKGTPCHKPG
jgi:RHS repeat-associated protein